ncbi:MAG: prepilin-type N-terminal cleavage/methylation domain-containing protein, partial [Eubacterium sp.]|nr:prepilin-type N-terminal cleavage/methylation domain-containing protein [Eubacterium sp.]
MRFFSTLKLNKETHKSDNKGFTLVELIVVLVIIVIMAAVGTFGVLGWQDWSRFQHENAVAEEIFFAAQIQLTELDSSGAFENRITEPLKRASDKDTDKYLDTGYASKYILSKELLGAISYEGEGDNSVYYNWNTIWKLSTNKDKQNDSIVRIRANKGDYKKYIEGKLLDGINYDSALSKEQLQKVGAKLLFDLVASYVSDTSVLNGAIVLEFSPDSCQVFSVCFTDMADGFIYDGDIGKETGDSDKYLISAIDRTLHTRSGLMFGYYSVDQLTDKIRGRGNRSTDIILELKNSDVLDLIVHDNAANEDKKLSAETSDTLDFSIFNGVTDTKVMTFTVKISDFKDTVNTIEKAAAKPVDVKISFEDGTPDTTYRLPMYKEGDDYHIILDAADVQAQTLSLQESLKILGDSDTDNDDEATFLNTYSFHRFRINAEKIYASVDIYKDGMSAGTTTSTREFGDNYIYEDSAGNQITESTCFASDPIAGDAIPENTYRIENGRHLYNVRYKTEYKSTTDAGYTFELVKDIDWNDFIGKTEDNTTNYFLNSYDTTKGAAHIASGIDYDGLSVATGVCNEVPASGNLEKTVYYSLRTEDVYNTANYPFPGFRCLGKDDKFCSKESADKKIYTISNLHITITGNILYGVYDTDTRQIKDACVKTSGEGDNKVVYDDYTAVLGLKDADAVNGSGSKYARAGLTPLGLFAENLGTIEDVALNKHIVEGMQRVYSNNKYTVVYSCMVGGFAGNNIGTVSGLTLYDNEKNNATSAQAKITHINGRTDVGGIIGRESFALNENADVTLEKLNNYGNVSGMENVGGIVGRAYVHYVGDDSEYNTSEYTGVGYGTNNTITDEEGRCRYEFYHDGYDITDSFKSMTGTSVHRAKTVKIKDCLNRGVVEGDSIVHNSSVNSTYAVDTDLHHYYESKTDYTRYYTQTNYSLKEDNKKVYRLTTPYLGKCAFIGGIAGIIQDGFIIDDSLHTYKRNNNSNSYEYDVYYDRGYFDGTFQTASIEDCDSVMLYDDSSANAIINSINNTNENKKFFNDMFVGGTVGYARLCAVKNCKFDESKDNTFGGKCEPHVFGYRYVGGFAGCSDFARYDESENSNDYIVENNSTVLGRYNVGGIAGAFGIGDSMQEGLSFREPSRNEAGRSSQNRRNGSTPANIIVKKLLNSGVVLGIDKNKTAFQNGVLENGNELKDINYYYSACIGGIAGETKVALVDCDNIQSEETKNKAIKLIFGNNYDIDALNNLSTAQIVAMSVNSRFGGSCVGGIVGKTRTYNNNNPSENLAGINGLDYQNNSGSEKYHSNVDAIVFGGDYVGGAIGFNSSHSNNLYPYKADASSTGLMVIGRDAIGGIVGLNAQENNNRTCSLNNIERGYYDSERTIDTPYRVYGRYGVGGVVGKYDEQECRISTALEDSDRISVNGLAYVGAFAGVAKNSEMKLFGNLSNVDVNSEYFAGGYTGAVTSNESISKIFNDYITNDGSKKLNTSNIVINSNAFSGGFSGLVTVRDLNNNDSQLHKVAKKLITETGSYQNKDISYDVQSDLKTAYDSIVAADIDNMTSVFNTNNTIENVFTGTSKDSTKEDRNYVIEGIEVNAGIFAGGMFGYVPNGMKLEVRDFTNNCSVKATSSVNGVSESYDSNVNYAYLGGIVGRVPMNTKLYNCKNLAYGEDDGQDGAYYVADAADYIGGLTEVNAGYIGGTVNNSGDVTYLENDTPYEYPGKKVGAFAGVNGTVNTKGNSTEEKTTATQGSDGTTTTNVETIYHFSGVIEHCINNVAISGDDAAGVSAGIGGKSDINDCINKGNINGTSLSAGIVGDCISSSMSENVAMDDNNEYGININNCINLGGIAEDAESSSGIAGNTYGCGNIQLCRNYGTGAEYGITSGEASTVTKNLEASGLNEENDANPIGPGVTTALNFYIYDDTSVTPEYNTGGGEGGEQGGEEQEEQVEKIYTNIDFSKYLGKHNDWSKNYEDRYNDGSSNPISRQYLIDKINSYKNNYEDGLYTSADDWFIDGIYKKFGENVETTIKYCSFVYAAFVVTERANGTYQDTNESFYKYIKDIVESHKLPGVSDDNMKYRSDGSLNSAPIV